MKCLDANVTRGDMGSDLLSTDTSKNDALSSIHSAWSANPNSQTVSGPVCSILGVNVMFSVIA